jgi:hypothetical protein
MSVESEILERSHPKFIEIEQLIADELSKMWTSRIARETIRDALTRPSYCGFMVQNQNYKGDFDHVPEDKKELFVIGSIGGIPNLGNHLIMSYGQIFIAKKQPRFDFSLNRDINIELIIGPPEMKSVSHTQRVYTLTQSFASNFGWTGGILHQDSHRSPLSHFCIYRMSSEMQGIMQQKIDSTYDRLISGAASGKLWHA